MRDASGLERSAGGASASNGLTESITRMHSFSFLFFIWLSFLSIYMLCIIAFVPQAFIHSFIRNVRLFFLFDWGFISQNNGHLCLVVVLKTYMSTVFFFFHKHIFYGMSNQYV